VAILTFRHKGLERFFLRGTTAGIQAEHASAMTGLDVEDVDYEDSH
jgi:plasmid maintenance system killer protein